MKRLILFAHIFLFSTQIFAQAINDDCSTAKYLGDIRNSQGTFQCLDGSPVDAGINSDSNSLATPSIPYLYSTHCQDFGTIANDVWYK